MSPKKVIFAVGTRPEAIKLFPVIQQFKDDTNYESVVVSTGQHKEILDSVYKEFGVSVDYNLSIMKPNQTLTSATSSIIEKVSELLSNLKPDIVFVQGDTTTTFATALSCFYLGFKVAHIEAGLRTFNFNEPFPEEMNRVLVSDLASLHFTPTVDNYNNLINEGIDKNRVFVVGNTVVDSLNFIKNRCLDSSYDNQDDTYKNIVFTCHRRENFSYLDKIFDSLSFIAENTRSKIYYPVHPNPNVQSALNRSSLRQKENIFLLDSLNYTDMVCLMNRASFVITDSGGLQEEAISLGVPVLILRQVTERKEGVVYGNAALVEDFHDSFRKKAIKIIGESNIYNSMISSHNPYGDGQSSLYIKNITDTFLSNAPLSSEYYFNFYVKNQIREMNSHFEFDRLSIFFDFYKIDPSNYCWDGNSLDIHEEMLILREKERKATVVDITSASNESLIPCSFHWIWVNVPGKFSPPKNPVSELMYKSMFSLLNNKTYCKGDLQINLWINSKELEKFFTGRLKQKGLYADVIFKDVDNLINDYGQAIQAVYKHFIQISPVVASDLLRSLIAYHEGGVYLDLDTEVLNTRDMYKLMHHYDYFTAECIPMHGSMLANAVLGGKKHNTISAAIVNDIADAHHDNDNRVHSICSSYIPYVTAFTGVVRTAMSYHAVKTSNDSTIKSLVLPNSMLFHNGEDESFVIKVSQGKDMILHPMTTHHHAGAWILDKNEEFSLKPTEKLLYQYCFDETSNKTSSNLLHLLFNKLHSGAKINSTLELKNISSDSLLNQINKYCSNIDQKNSQFICYNRIVGELDGADTYALYASRYNAWHKNKNILVNIELLDKSDIKVFTPYDHEISISDYLNKENDDINQQVLKVLGRYEDHLFINKVLGYLALYNVGGMLDTYGGCTFNVPKIASFFTEVPDHSHELNTECVYAQANHPIILEMLEQFLEYEESTKYDYLCRKEIEEILFSQNSLSIAYFKKSNINDNVDLVLDREGQYTHDVEYKQFFNYINNVLKNDVAKFILSQGIRNYSEVFHMGHDDIRNTVITEFCNNTIDCVDKIAPISTEVIVDGFNELKDFCGDLNNIEDCVNIMSSVSTDTIYDSFTSFHDSAI